MDHCQVLENDPSEELIANYQDYLRKIAYFVKISLPDNIEYEDLVQYGQIGLIEAARKFDPGIGVSFKTYSYYRIKGSIYDGLRSMGLFKNKQYKKHLIQNRINDLLLQETNSRNPANPSYESYEKIERLRDVFSSAATVITVSYASYMDYEVNNDSKETITGLISGEAKEFIMDAINKLPKKERDVIRLYYFDELTFEEIGKRMALSKSWVSRIHLSAVNKLKHNLKRLK